MSPAISLASSLKLDSSAGSKQSKVILLGLGNRNQSREAGICRVSTTEDGLMQTLDLEICRVFLIFMLDAKLGGVPWAGQRTASRKRTTTRELVKVLGLKISWETF